MNRLILYISFTNKTVLTTFFYFTSVDTEMCCPKGKCGCQYFILLTFKKKKSWTQGSWIFNKKLITHFCVHTCKIKKSCENSFVCERNVQNLPIHVIRALYIDESLYLTLTIQASSRLKRSDNHLWNNSDVCRKKFGEWSLLPLFTGESYCWTFKLLIVLLEEKSQSPID
jgi:hypothetical protein